MNWWRDPTISSSVSLFSFCLQSFITSGSFPMSWLFKWSGQNIRASASVLLMNIQDWFPFGLTGLISLLSKGFSRVFSSTTIWKHQFFGISAFFMVQFSIDAILKFLVTYSFHWVGFKLKSHSKYSDIKYACKIHLIYLMEYVHVCVCVCLFYATVMSEFMSKQLATDQCGDWSLTGKEFGKSHFV